MKMVEHEALIMVSSPELVPAKLEPSHIMEFLDLQANPKQSRGFWDTLNERQQPTDEPSVPQASVSSHEGKETTSSVSTITSSPTHLSTTHPATTKPTTTLGSAAAAAASSNAAVSQNVADFNSAFPSVTSLSPSAETSLFAEMGIPLPSSSSHHLSQAALVVAIVIPVLALTTGLAILFLWIRDRRKRRRSPSALEPKRLLPTRMIPWRTRQEVGTSIPLRSASRNSGYYTGLNSSTRPDGGDIEPPPPYQRRISLHDEPVDESVVSTTGLMYPPENQARGGSQHVSEANIDTRQHNPAAGLGPTLHGFPASPFAHPDDHDRDDAVSEISDTFERRITSPREADEVSVLSTSDMSRPPVTQEHAY